MIDRKLARSGDGQTDENDEVKRCSQPIFAQAHAGKSAPIIPRPTLAAANRVRKPMPTKKAPIDSFSVIHNARMNGNGKPTCAISGASPMDDSGFPAWNAVTYHPIFCMPKVNASRNPAARKTKSPGSIISKGPKAKLKEKKAETKAHDIMSAIRRAFEKRQGGSEMWWRTARISCALRSARYPLSKRKKSNEANANTKYKGEELMKAIRVDEFGSGEVLRLEEVPTPQPGPGQVLVRMHAILLPTQPAAVA